MCEQENLTILKLVRVAFGPLGLGDLAQGKVRELTPSELSALRKASAHKQKRQSVPNHRPALSDVREN